MVSHTMVGRKKMASGLKNITNNDKSNARLFIAVYIDEIRLIDNIKL